MKRFFLFAMLIVLLAGCAIQSGSMSGSACLSSNNFKYLGQATGYAKTTHVIGFGGLDANGLVRTAKNDLIQSCNLQSGQALANLSVDFKDSYYLIIFKREVFVTADIVDFNLNSNNRLDSLHQIKQNNGSMPTNKIEFKGEDELKKYNRKIESYNGFFLDEMVKIPNRSGTGTITGRIMELQKTGAIIKFENESGGSETRFFEYRQISAMSLK